VAWIAAHDADHAPAANDLALIANTPNTGTDFHGNAHSQKLTGTLDTTTDNRIGVATTKRRADRLKASRLAENG
jgi:hypothetical protein